MTVENWDSRTRLMLGDDKLLKLKSSHVLVAGLGGVGAYAAEMLCRAGVGGNYHVRWRCGFGFESKPTTDCSQKHFWQIQSRTHERSTFGHQSRH